MIIEKCYTPQKIFSIGLSLVSVLIFSNVLHAQFTEFDPEYYYLTSIEYQKNGMMILGSWAGLNLISGVSGNFALSNEHKYFFQMNAAWGLINLGIAGIGYYNTLGLATGIPTSEMLSQMNKLDTILLINTGLDVLYIGTGSWLLNRGLKKNDKRFIGYGRSVILQGGFLILFDLAFYLIHSPQTKALYQITEKITISPTGFLLRF